MTTVQFEDTIPTSERVTLADDINPICGCLEWKSSGNGYGYAAVRAVGRGSFRWVYTRNGRIIAISEYQHVEQGDERDARAGSDVQISITCD